MTGKTTSHYKIVEKPGKSGMSDIYRVQGATLRFGCPVVVTNTFERIVRMMLLVLFLVPVYLHAQNTDLKFERIGREQGLTASSVLSIAQDRQGFM